MSEQHTAEYMAGYWDGRMRNVKQMETEDYIAGYLMGNRIPNGPKLALPPPPQQSTSLQAQFKIPGTHPDYINGFRDGKLHAKKKLLKTLSIIAVMKWDLFQFRQLI
jgi:hypothetical protein